MYYEKYDDIERHFKKSHFVCELGMCIGKKFENAFISAEALEDHKNKVHKKHKGKEEKNVISLALFNQKNDDEADVMEWDKIGKNF